MKKIFLFLVLATCGSLMTCEKTNVAAEKKTEQKPIREPYFFIQMSDPQLGFIDNNVSFEEDSRLFRQAIDVVNRLKPDFVVITGDFVNASRSEGQILEFKRLLKYFDRSIPVHLLPGNHDISDTNAEESYRTYLKNYGYDRFDFTHKESAFIGINSVLVKNENLPVQESEQFKWLGRVLKRTNDSRFRFVFMHHSLFVKSPDEKDSYSNFQAPMREKYVTLLKQNGVNAVFAGHAHYDYVAADGDLQMFTCGSTGKPLGKGYPGMNLVKVYPDRFEVEYLALDDFPDNIVF